MKHFTKHSKAASGDVLKNFAIFTEKYLCWSLFLIKFFFSIHTYNHKNFEQAYNYIQNKNKMYKKW